jgi:hypothetical protein
VFDSSLAVVAVGFVALLAGSGAAQAPAADTDVPYGVAAWAESLGNHRARVRVVAAADAVRIHIPWRRRDDEPERKAVVVADIATGKLVRNVAPISITREAGDVAFKPEAGPGEYAVYFMPVSVTGWENGPTVTYPPPADTADPAWLLRNGLPSGAWQALPEARLLAIEARGEFQRRDPMELPATATEMQALLAAHAREPYLLFPEDREHAIRMPDALPLRWIRRGPSAAFTGMTPRGGFFVFQVGVYATQATLADVKVGLGALKSASGATIPASALRCINTGGVDWLGRKIRRTVNVPQGQVQPLWIGVDVPEGASPGEYVGAVTIRPANAPARRVAVHLTLRPQVLAAHGEDDIHTLARLRWLDSTIGLDDQVTRPFTPVKVTRGAVECLGRTVRFGRDGMPESIASWGHEILARPMRLVLDTTSGQGALTGGPTKVARRGAAAVERETIASAPDATVRCRSRIEFDGHIGFEITLHATKDLALRDVRLEIPMRSDMAAYMMGMGKEGGYRPKEWRWKWNINQTNNMVWVGTPEAGIQVKLTGPTGSETLYSLQDEGLPKAWSNDGQGGCEVVEDGAGAVVIRAFSGSRTMHTGDALQFNFELLITPFKPLDPAHWSWRYYHFLAPVVPIDTIALSGARIATVHQGNDLNRYINYPFQNVDRLEPYIREAHKRGLKAKIYYTVRELSNYCSELWALRSLGYEILSDGGGGGDPWLRKHLVSHFGAAWRQPYKDGETDAAIATTGLSRWHNYYLEGLSWLIRKVGIDGLYLDGIGYDRRVMQRVRKVMDRARPGCLIDFHSGNEFHPEYGQSSPANKYMQHFPYIDSLWLGEGYDYNMPPDYWLVEISGLPFGLYSEMLQDGGNPWRGMVFGMTNRLGWGGDPRAVWKVWDDFGIAEATPRFYFQKACPVRTGRDDVLATAYVRKDRTLIAIASWAKETVRVNLAIDWKALGLDPATARLTAPDAPGFQHAATFAPGDAISVEPGRGWLLVVR